MNSNMNVYINNDIRAELKGIFLNRFEINFENEDMDYMDEHLLGNKIRLTPRGLLYLLRDIENTFNIEIPAEYIVNDKFTSFNNIYEIISIIRNK